MTNAAKKPARPLILEDPATLRGKDKSIGGSQHDGWNLVIANHVINSLRPISDEAESDKAKTAAVQGLIGINPKDELKGMLAAQLVACHNASMECYRRAMLREQTFEGRQENLNRSEQALADVFSAARIPQSPPWQGPAEDDGRACPRLRGRPGHRRQRREPGGRVRTEIKGTTPCTWICTRHHDAERGHVAGACVSRRR